MSGVLAVLALGAGALWIDSLRAARGIAWDWDGGGGLLHHQCGIGSDRGWVAAGASHFGYGTSADRRNAEALIGPYKQGLTFGSYRPPIQYSFISDARIDTPFLHFGSSSFFNPEQRHTEWGVELPYWLLVPSLAAWPLLQCLRAMRRAACRPRPGACHTCGYDLTGNVSGVCPECGTPVPAVPDPSRARAGTANPVR